MGSGMQSIFICLLLHRGWSCAGLKSFCGNTTLLWVGRWGKAVNLAGSCFRSPCLCPAGLLFPTASSSSSGCCHQLGWESSTGSQRSLWKLGERGECTILSYYDLLSCFSFLQPLLAGKLSGRSCQVQEVRWKLWAEPSMGRSLNPKTVHGGSANRM